MQAERNGAELLFAARQRAARAEIDAAVAREREARRAVEIYSTNVRELARQNVDVMLEAYDLGRFPLSDVLTEQRRYLEVEGAYTEVLLRAYEARRRRAGVRRNAVIGPSGRVSWPSSPSPLPCSWQSAWLSVTASGRRWPRPTMGSRRRSM